MSTTPANHKGSLCYTRFGHHIYKPTRGNEVSNTIIVAFVRYENDAQKSKRSKKENYRAPAIAWAKFKVPTSHPIGGDGQPNPEWFTILNFLVSSGFIQDYMPGLESKDWKRAAASFIVANKIWEAKNSSEILCEIFNSTDMYKLQYRNINGKGMCFDAIYKAMAPADADQYDRYDDLGDCIEKVREGIIRAQTNTRKKEEGPSLNDRLKVLLNKKESDMKIYTDSEAPKEDNSDGADKAKRPLKKKNIIPLPLDNPKKDQGPDDLDDPDFLGKVLGG